MLLVAAGLIDLAGDRFVDVSTGGEAAADYLMAFFEASEKFDKAA